PLDRLLAAWAAISVTEESDEISGENRKSMVENCLVVAILASRELRPHPLDELISRERDTKIGLYQPLEGQFWKDDNRTNQARMASAVVRSLEMVRKGLRPQD